MATEGLTNPYAGGPFARVASAQLDIDGMGFASLLVGYTRRLNKILAMLFLRPWRRLRHLGDELPRAEAYSHSGRFLRLIYRSTIGLVTKSLCGQMRRI